MHLPANPAALADGLLRTHWMGSGLIQLLFMVIIQLSVNTSIWGPS